VTVDRIRFQLDEHVSPAIARALRQRSIDVITTGEAGLLGASDVQHLARAHAEGRVLVTQDDDFLALHHEQQPHAGIVYCKQGSRSIGQIVAGLILVYEVLEPHEMAGQVEYL
jgi:predicted nuclease of predicted toxin-antitoxin system